MSPVRLLPWFLHEAIEYAAGLFLVIAPFLFAFTDDGTATVVFVVTGVVVLLVAVISQGPLAGTQTLPAQAHATLDYVLALFLVLAPFLFGFTGTTAALYISVLLGIAHLAITLATRFPLETPKSVQRHQRRAEAKADARLQRQAEVSRNRRTAQEAADSGVLPPGGAAGDGEPVPGGVDAGEPATGTVGERRGGRPAE